MRLSLPNLITIARILIVPVVIFLINSGQMSYAFVLFILAGLSDGVDGFIAKRFDQATKLGAYLDPVADKILLVSIYLTLGQLGHLPGWLVILVVSRDLLIVGAFLLAWIMGLNIKVAPLMVSKANTTAQIMLAGLILANLGYDLHLSVITSICLYAVVVLTVLSGIAYLVEWMRDMVRFEDGNHH